MMNWTYSIKNKLAASAALFSLCILVLVSHYIDRNHTENVKNAISTLYEDRLIAEEYILKMTTGFYQIKEEIHTNPNFNESVEVFFNEIMTVSNAYQKTKFTEVERQKGDELLRVLATFKTIKNDNKAAKLVVANKALVILNQLSAIQLAESKQIMNRAESLYLSGETSSQFVFVVIIIILIVLQAIVFTSKSLITKTKYPNLN